jgi:hypothetical protein
MDVRHDQDYIAILNALASNCRATITYQIGMPAGCTWMVKLLTVLSPRRQFHFPVFQEYLTAIHPYATGTGRLHWNRKALFEQDQRFEEINREYRDRIHSACHDILEILRSEDSTNAPRLPHNPGSTAQSVGPSVAELQASTRAKLRKLKARRGALLFVTLLSACSLGIAIDVYLSEPSYVDSSEKAGVVYAACIFSALTALFLFAWLIEWKRRPYFRKRPPPPDVISSMIPIGPKTPAPLTAHAIANRE